MEQREKEIRIQEEAQKQLQARFVIINNNMNVHTGYDIST